MIFFAVLMLMGAASVLAPMTFIAVLQRRQTPTAGGHISAFRIIGAVVALVSVAEIISIVAVSHLVELR